MDEEPQGNQPISSQAFPPTEAPQPLQYEETPILEPIPQTPENAPPQSGIPMPSGELPPRSPAAGILGNILLFGLLFALGVWLSTMIRPYLNGGFSLNMLNGKTLITPTPLVPTPLPTQPPEDQFTNWKTVEVISGVTKKPIAGITFKLPPQIQPTVCDSGGCASQGTNLPGGTRFTVAARGAGQLLVDFRGGLLTDISGQPFTMKQATISGYPATEYTASFSGRTAGGYSFTQMRGEMVNINDSLTLELNHFTPASTPSADFTTDDELFNKILQTITFGILTPIPTPASGSGNEPG